MSDTIKERLLADIRQHSDNRGRVSLTPATLAKRHGLNAHDLQKNLFQLEQEGYLRLRSTRGSRREPGSFEAAGLRLRVDRLNDDRLTRPPVLSTPDRVRQWVLDHQDQLGWAAGTPSDIARALGVDFAPGNRVSQAVSAMLRDGTLTARRDGPRITGLRITVPERSQAPQRAAQPAVEPPVVTATVVTAAAPGASVVTVPICPELDKYVAARRMARLTPADNPYLTIQFTEVPIAEEAIRLRDALRACLGQSN